MRANQQNMRTRNNEENLSGIIRDMVRYQAFSIASKDVDVLQWWKAHEKVLPNLAIIAKKF